MYFYIILFLVLFVISKLTKSWRLRWFAKFLNGSCQKRTPEFKKFMRDHLRYLHTLTSHDPTLRKEKALRILEVGIGTGANLEYYPEGTRLIAVDPNPHYKEYYNENRKKFPNIHSTKVIQAFGEEIDEVESNSVDAVVISHVLCSVTAPKKFLSQMKRVLVPGGSFVFIEHIAEFEPSKYYFRRFFQEFLTICWFHPFFFDGCCLNKKPLRDIEAAGFTKVESKYARAPYKHWYLKMAVPHVIGVCIK